ncbi:MAG: M12 family metallo-peptidase [Planctomycetota bacterium]
MKRKTLLACSGAGLAGLVLAFGAFTNASIDALPQVPEATPQSTPVGLAANLTDWSLQKLELPQTADSFFRTKVVLDGNEYTLSLSPYTMRSPDFHLYVVGEDGVQVEVAPPPPTTMRGFLDELPHSVVAASLENGKLSAMIDMGDGAPTWFIQPLSDYETGLTTEDHVTYMGSAAIAPADAQCGNDILFPQKSNSPGPGQPRSGIQGTGKKGNVGGGGSSSAAAADETAAIAYDADFEWFQLKGGSVSNAVAGIENIMNGVETIYQRDVGICYTIANGIIRASSNDPYSGDIQNRLGQFQAEWNANNGAIGRDMAHFFSGLGGGGVIGVAFLGVVCTKSQAYGASKVGFTSNLSMRIGLVAHESGHNWNAGHCNSGNCNNTCNDCRIMCACINSCCGDVTKFGATSVNQITNFKNSRGCLNNGCGGTFFILHTPLEPGVAPADNTWFVTGATPGATVEIFWGKKPGTTAAPGCAGVNLDLKKAKSLGTSVADQHGNATVTLFVPAKASGRTLQFQALDRGVCKTSAPKAMSFN